MLYSHVFAESKAYRDEVLPWCEYDTPLVVQFAGNDAQTLLRACRFVQNRAFAVDLNFGCPLREAQRHQYGYYLLHNKQNRQRILHIVRFLVQNLQLPVFCKIRLLPTPSETVEFAKELELAGCSLLTVHARQGLSPQNKRYGPAFLQFVKDIKAHITIPVICNGNVRSWDDIIRNLQYTQADGVMCAESIISNPALFYPATQVDSQTVQDTLTRIREHHRTQSMRLQRLGCELYQTQHPQQQPTL
uniref:tRNA-dihydrouridine(16/17) synthase [NAD(P)(+)] n=2 Tax=Lygus hesperus TaxID=30085 RepID=A0A146LRY5_LYGHE